MRRGGPVGGRVPGADVSGGTEPVTAEQMWAEFASGRGLGNTPYEAWAYGGDADALARLTLAGKKTATSSALPLYGLEGAPLPEAGEYSVILDSRKQAVCVIRTERVAVVPYRDVTADHARREGEGDCSLAFWRQVHQAFFTEELARAGMAFRQDLPVVCEEFVKVYPE